MTDWHDRTLADYLAGAEDAYGLPEKSGGHTWRNMPHGRVCADCGRRWAEVVGATQDAILKKHYAHIGKLANFEQEQYAREVDWLWSTIVDAASAGKA
jgi:hypothetical protein